MEIKSFDDYLKEANGALGGPQTAGGDALGTVAAANQINSTITQPVTPGLQPTVTSEFKGNAVNPIGAEVKTVADKNAYIDGTAMADISHIINAVASRKENGTASVKEINGKNAIVAGPSDTILGSFDSKEIADAELDINGDLYKWWAGTALVTGKKPTI